MKKSADEILKEYESMYNTRTAWSSTRYLIIEAMEVYLKQPEESKVKMIERDFNYQNYLDLSLYDDNDWDDD